MSETKKKIGRPSTDTAPITVRLSADDLEWLDSIRLEGSRQQAVRRIIKERRASAQ
jgi:ribosomal protein L16/L10AE